MIVVTTCTTCPGWPWLDCSYTSHLKSTDHAKGGPRQAIDKVWHGYFGWLTVAGLSNTRQTNFSVRGWIVPHCLVRGCFPFTSAICWVAVKPQPITPRGGPRRAIDKVWHGYFGWLTVAGLRNTRQTNGSVRDWIVPHCSVRGCFPFISAICWAAGKKQPLTE